MAFDENQPVDRRRFFRMGMAQLLRPLSQAVQQLGKLEKIGKPAAPRRFPLDVWLRPPGALPEQKFRATCSRCGECVRVCPAHAIQIDPTSRQGNGVPFIEANADACVVCQGLQCMSACPSGALVPTSINDIDMGAAVWLDETCVRTKGESCTICIDHCPLGSAAIELKNGKVDVKPLGCIGCGVCQRDCPTSPRSIVVIPIAAKTAGIVESR